MKKWLQYNYSTATNMAVRLIRLTEGFSIGLLPNAEKHELVYGCPWELYTARDFILWSLSNFSSVSHVGASKAEVKLERNEHRKYQIKGEILIWYWKICIKSNLPCFI